MVGMPEKTAVVGGTVFFRMINIDIDHMSRKVFHELKPTRVPTAQELNQQPIDDIVLVVVVRYQRTTTMANRFVIGIKVAKVAPAILVYDFTPCKKRLRTVDCYVNQILTLAM